MTGVVDRVTWRLLICTSAFAPIMATMNLSKAQINQRHQVWSDARYQLVQLHGLRRAKFCWQLKVSGFRFNQPSSDLCKSHADMDQKQSVVRRLLPRYLLCISASDEKRRQGAHFSWPAAMRLSAWQRGLRFIRGQASCCPHSLRRRPAGLRGSWSAPARPRPRG